MIFIYIFIFIVVLVRFMCLLVPNLCLASFPVFKLLLMMRFAYYISGIGCQIAGFITVFASELSIVTLTVITLERWFAITYAINLNKRIRLKCAAKVMVFGWIYALTMATLPVLGISSYTKTSICLPMGTEDTTDLIYLIILLSINGLAFILICACYGKMYITITAQHCVITQNDKTVAKRMAMLVFTDFACWAPIAFFGLTAIAGHPLIDVTESKFLLVFFYPLNSCANPFLYAIMTNQYKRELFSMLSRYGFCKNRAKRYKPYVSNLNQHPHRASQKSSSHTQVTVHDIGKTLKDMDSPSKGKISAGCNSSNMLPDLEALYGTKDSRRHCGTSSRRSDNDKCGGRTMARGSPHLLKNTTVMLDPRESDVMNSMLTDATSPKRRTGEMREMFIFKSSKKRSSKQKLKNRTVELKL